MRPKHDDMTGHDIGTGVQLLAPKQLFTCPLPNNSEHEVEKAKKLIYEMASSMGFIKHHPWRLEIFHDREDDMRKWRLEADFFV